MRKEDAYYEHLVDKRKRRRMHRLAARHLIQGGTFLNHRALVGWHLRAARYYKR